MADGQEKELKAPVGVRVGKVIANAGKVAGVVALGAAVAHLTGLDKGIMEGLGDSGSGTLDLSGVGQWLSNSSFTLDPNAVDTGRTALFGAGLLGASTLINSKVDQAEDRALRRKEDEVAYTGFAANEQMKAIQGVMKARMAMASPEYMQEMGGGRAMA